MFGTLDAVWCQVLEAASRLVFYGLLLAEICR